MKRPERVKILGQWCKVNFTDLKEEGNRNNEILYGDCNLTTRTIRVEQSLDDEIAKRVLRHEKMHMKLGLSGLSEMLNPEQEEALCVLMESE